MQNLILAAGLAKRAGGQKLFYLFEGETLIHRTVRISVACHLDTTVVTGFRHKEVEALLKGLPVHIVYNSDFETGQFSSTQCGVKQLRPDEPFFITLADLPLIGQSHYRAGAEHLLSYDAARPFFNKRPGHPVLHQGSLIERILNCSPDSSMRELLSTCRVNNYESDEGCVTDIDTPRAYRNLLTRLKENRPSRPE